MSSPGRVLWAMKVLLSLWLRRLLLWGQVEQSDEVDGIPFEAGHIRKGVFGDCVCEGYVDVFSFRSRCFIYLIFIWFSGAHVPHQHDVVFHHLL